MLIVVACVLAVIAVPLLLATTARLVVAGSTEFRARVLETVAAAVRRGIAVDPQFLWLIAHDARGRRRRAVLRAARALDDGRPLSASLALALRLSPQATAMIAAAEGTRYLGDVLRTTADADRLRADLRHRLLVRLAYPMLVLTFLGGFLGLGVAPRFHDVVATLDIAPGSFFAALEVARVLGLALLGTTALVALSGVPIVARSLGHLVGCRRAAPTARAGAFLHTLSAAVRAGRPLDVALERTAGAAGHPRHVRAVRAAARRAREGEDAAALFTSLPLPGWLLARAPLLTGPPAMLAESLRELAESASSRAHAAETRFLTLLTPLLLTVTGGVLCMVFLTFFAMLQRIRETALPW